MWNHRWPLPYRYSNGPCSSVLYTGTQIIPLTCQPTLKEQKLINEETALIITHCSVPAPAEWPTLFYLYETDWMKLTSQMMTEDCYSNLKVNRQCNNMTHMVWSLLWSSLTEDNVLCSYLKPWSFLLLKSSTEHEFLISGYYRLICLMYGALLALLAEKKHITSSQSSILEFKLQSEQVTYTRRNLNCYLFTMHTVHITC